MKKAFSSSLAPSGRGLDREAGGGACGRFRHMICCALGFCLCYTGDGASLLPRCVIFLLPPVFSLSRLRATAPSRREPEEVVSSIVCIAFLTLHAVFALTPAPGHFIPKSPGSRQLSRDKPAIPAKSLVLSVTRVKPKDRAWAAIILSLS